MNKKQMINEIQSLKKSVVFLEAQLKEKREKIREETKDIHRHIEENTGLCLPAFGIQTLTVPGDPQGRRYIKAVDLVVAIMEHFKLTLEYRPGRYTLKEIKKG